MQILKMYKNMSQRNPFGLYKTIKINKIFIAQVWSIRRGGHFPKILGNKEGVLSLVTGLEFHPGRHGQKFSLSQELRKCQGIAAH